MAHPRNFDSEFHSKNWPTSQEAAQKKIEGETKMKEATSRGIVMKLICCMALVVLASAVALSQTPKPKSGAMLEIQGTVGSTPIDLRLYDSQIHSGSVQVVPVNGSGGSACLSTAGDNIPTDAYVLQGGAPTGCDPNDPFEVTDNNPAGTHQAFGLKSETKFSGFHIETHYLSEPIVNIYFARQTGTTTTYSYTLTRGADLVGGETIVISDYTGTDVGNNGTFPINSVGSGMFSVTNASGIDSGQSVTGTVSNAVCNTTGTICANPDSGFLTVTNDTDSDFTGTISLTGMPQNNSCAAASDSTSGLLAGSSVTLALGPSGGTTQNPIEIDSSNCGGFNQAQLLTLTPNVTKSAFFGKDDYQITTLNSAAGDTLSVLPVPVPAGPLGLSPFGPFPPGCVSPNCTFLSGDFGKETPSLPSPLRFSAGTNPNLGGTTFACVPYADFSADGNPVCAELQIECTNTITATDCSGFFYNVQNDFDIDGFSLPGGIGGPAFLGHHQVDCPNSAFDQNIFLNISPSYTQPRQSGASCAIELYLPNSGTPFVHKRK